MSSTKLTRALALAVSLGLSLSATFAYSADYLFRIPHVTSANEPVHEALEHFAKLITERSDGRIEAEVYPGGQLGTNLEMFEQVDLGAEIIILADPGYLSNFLADFGVLNGPYLLDSPADFQKIIESDWYAGLVNKLRDETNLELLTLNWFFGDRNVISDRPVETVEDFKALAIRVPPNPMWIETFESLGARGEQVAWAEVYGALASGVVDAAEAPLGSIYGASLHENAKTISMTGHFYSWIGLAMNDELYASMPEDLQKVLQTSAIDAGNFMTDLVQKKQSEFIATLEKEGVTFVMEVDRAGMREATIPVYSAFPEWSDGLVDDVRAILAQ